MIMARDVARALPRKVGLSKAEVLRGTGWTEYRLKQYEAAGLLRPYRWSDLAWRRYRRSEVVALLKEEAGDE